MNKLYLSAEELGAKCQPPLGARMVQLLAKRNGWRTSTGEPLGGRPKLLYNLSDAVATLGGRLTKPLAENSADDRNDSETGASQAAENAAPITAGAGVKLEDVSHRAREAVGRKIQELDALEQYLTAQKGDRTLVEVVDEFVAIRKASMDGTGGRISSRQTLLRLRSKRRDKGDEGLIDGRAYNEAAAARRKEIPKELWDAFRGFYLRRQALKVPPARHYALLQFPAEQQKQWKIEYPSALFRRRVAEIPKPILILAREGPKAYAQKCEAILERDYTTIDTNDLWNADHHTCDFWVYDDATRKAYRPVMTTIQDVRSRLIVAAIVEIGAPDQHRVMMAFAKAVLSYGLPRAIMLDNGRDFRAKKFSGGRRRQRELFIEADQDRARSILGVLLVEAQFVTAYLARAKPVERSYGFFEEWYGKLWESYWSNQPNSQLKPERAKELVTDNPESLPRIGDVQTFVAVAWNSFNQTWQHSGHGMNGRTPQQVYDAHLHRAMIRPSQDDLKLLLMPSELVTVLRSKVAVTIAGERVSYTSDVISNLEGHQVRVRYNPESLDKAYLFNAKDEYLHGHDLRLKERMPFGTGTEQLRPAIREQRRAKKVTRDAVEAVQNLREQPTVQDVVQQMNEEAEAAQRKAAQLRATGTDGEAASGRAKSPKQNRPRLRVVREPDDAPPRPASDNLRELADLLASQVQSDPEGSESW